MFCQAGCAVSAHCSERTWQLHSSRRSIGFGRRTFKVSLAGPSDAGLSPYLLRAPSRSIVRLGAVPSRRLFADLQVRNSQRPPVIVDVEKTSWNSRRLFAGVQIAAPLQSVWQCLTDYENLHKFIPNLVQNKCLERRPQGCVLYQVGAQDVALGLKFSAAVTLECIEFLSGVPPSMCSSSNDSAELLFPAPRLTMKGVPYRDITFSLVEGDFKAFKGVWRMQHRDEEAGTSMLYYALYVKPQHWLPVGLIQSRIEREIKANLDALRQHAERLHNTSTVERT